MQDESTTIEEWRPVANYEGYYEVSDQGRVRALERLVPRVYSDGRSEPFTRKSRDVQSFHDRCGYSRVELSRCGLPRKWFVHRLVLVAFVGVCPAGLQCRHLDGDPSNNRLSNLQWGSATENAADRVRHGTAPRGERHQNARLTASAVADIRARAKSVTVSRLAREYGVSRTTVRRAASGQTWAHLPHVEGAP